MLYDIRTSEKAATTLESLTGVNREIWLAEQYKNQGRIDYTYADDDVKKIIINHRGHYPDINELEMVVTHITTSSEKCSHICQQGIVDLVKAYEFPNSELRQFLKRHEINIDIEDLIVKYNGEVIEAVQVKNITAALTVSHLSSAKTSKGGEGFFKRMCSLHSKYPDFKTIKVVYFGDLGVELQELEKGFEKTKESIIAKLVDNHGLLDADAEWLLNSLKFEKVEEEQLTDGIHQQIKSYMPVMAAPYLAQSLLVQYISKLSKEKGYTCLNRWKEEIHKIGTSIAGIDGYFKEYDKSLIRLSELTMDKDYNELKDEFLQGVSAHPMHIRSDLDFLRVSWINEIKKSIDNYEATIVKGVSGQGKSTLCYRYLLEMMLYHKS